MDVITKQEGIELAGVEVVALRWIAEQAISDDVEAAFTIDQYEQVRAGLASLASRGLIEMKPDEEIPGNTEIAYLITIEFKGVVVKQKFAITMAPPRSNIAVKARA
jgi:hypothetical protein